MPKKARYRYNLVIDQELKDKADAIATREGKKLIDIFILALKIFFLLYNANKNGKDVMIDKTKVQFIF